MKSKYKVLIGLSYKIVELLDVEYEFIVSYGKCLTENELIINIDGISYSSKDIDDIEKI